MNIGITVYPTYGGSGIVGSELGKELAARGHTVHFISSALPTRLTELNERVRFHEVEMMSYPLFEHQPYTLALATKMSTVAEAEKLDLLHVHYAIPHCVTAISNYLKQATIEHFQFDRIEVIPNFVCPDEYKPKIDCDLRSALSPDGAPVMVHVSNFRPVKRPVDCVEILARVLKKTKARLVMVGDGSERTSVIHRARCLGVADGCIFVGKQPLIVDYLCASDILLLPSEQESFGLAALEAMAVQVPVIATRVGGLPEVVDDGETGFLSAVGDVDKMADDAARLLSDKELRRQMGRRARASATSRYSTDLIIPQYVEFYERILKKQRS